MFMLLTGVLCVVHVFEYVVLLLLLYFWGVKCVRILVVIGYML